MVFFIMRAPLNGVKKGQNGAPFEGSALVLTSADEPSNILWENQDAPAWERSARSFVVNLICVPSPATHFTWTSFKAGSSVPDSHSDCSANFAGIETSDYGQKPA